MDACNTNFFSTTVDEENGEENKGNGNSIV